MTDKEKTIKELKEVLDSLDITNKYRLNLIRAIEYLQEEPVSKRLAFKAIPRLLEMIEPTDRAKAYIAKLAETLEVEGYSTDAKIVRESLKIMNGEKVPMATMDEEPVSEELKVELEKYIKDHFTIDTEQLDKFGIEEEDYMYSMDKSDMLALVEHFTKWGKNQGKVEIQTQSMALAHGCPKEYITEDLKEEINNYVKRNGYDGLDSIEEVKYIANHTKTPDRKDYIG